MRHPRRRSLQTLLVMIALAALSMALLTGCARSGGEARGPAAGTHQSGSDAVVVTGADAGQSVSVSPGQRLDVVLDANPSTGYTWTVRSAPEFLESQGEPDFSSEGASDVVGAGGRQTLEFSVTALGRGTLVLDYVRPWEKGVPPATTFSVRVDSR